MTNPLTRRLLTGHLLSVLFGLVVLAPAFAARAAPPALDRIQSGTLYLRGSEGAMSDAPRVDTAIHAAVTGNLVRAFVTQDFVNPSDRWVEGLYAFPLSATAAVDELEMHVDERIVRGEIRERDAARAQFKQAAQDGKRASLVEQQRPNLFTTAVANIPPHAKIRVLIGYFDTVEFRDGGYRLHLPLAITPRYAPAISEDAVTKAQEISALSQNVAPQAQRASIDIELRAGVGLASLQSPSHLIKMTEHETLRSISLASGSVPQDRDFELVWAPVSSPATQAAAFTQCVDGATYALVSLMPPSLSGNSELRREVLYIIDTSGSMQGPSIDQARDSLLMAIDSLKPGDRFNVIRFSSDASSLFERPAAVYPQSLDAARRFVRNLQADGGTEMRAALEMALAMPATAGMLRQIVFITDGAVSNEQELMHLLHTRLGETRLFTVGIGAAPNAFFMQEAAAAGRGSYTFIADGSEIRERMTALLLKLSQPALTDLSLTWPNGAKAELAGALPSDLYVGDPVILVARLPDSVAGLLTLSGAGMSGRWSTRIPISVVPVSAGISKLWARERIRSYERELTAADKDAELRALVLPLALQHRLVSRYTSLIAVDQTPARPAGEQSDKTVIAATPPAGSAWASTGFAPTATPSAEWILLGCAFLVFGLWLQLPRLRCRA